VQQVIEQGTHMLGRLLDELGVSAARLLQPVAVLLDQDFGEPAQRAQWGPQVMSGRVGKGGQVLVGPFQVHGALPHPLSQGGVQGPDLPVPPERLAFGVLTGGDVPVDLQETQQRSTRPALRCPAALHDDGPPIGAAVGKLALPAAIPGHGGLDDGQRLGKVRAKQVVGFAADRLSTGEAISVRSTCVPVRDLPVQVPDENPVVGQFQQRSLAGDDLFPDIALRRVSERSDAVVDLPASPVYRARPDLEGNHGTVRLVDLQVVSV
jgi:hypothetical protein